MPGYLDCQLHYQGFKARVIAHEGLGYWARDLKGQDHYCKANGLLLDTEPSALPHYPAAFNYYSAHNGRRCRNLSRYA